jgi:hypothetical protein
MSSLQIGYDCTGENIAHLPAGVKYPAGYTTGGSLIEWTAADWVKYPDAVRICQDAGATDGTADVLDIESGAATIADAPGWYDRAKTAFTASTRPGQRQPAFYVALGNVTPLVNGLVAAGVTSGPCLWVAHWDITQAQAAADITDTGPYPIVAYQFTSDQAYDIDLWLESWLTDQSKAAPVVTEVRVQYLLSDGTVQDAWTGKVGTS